MFGQRPDPVREEAMLSAITRLSNEVEQMGRKLTELQVSIAGMRRKLGFEDSWAEMKHDQDYIDALKAELREKQRRSL